MESKIGIPDPDRQTVAEVLSKLLADEFLLYTKTRKAHWNIEGPDFHAAHLFFEKQYEELDEIMDSVAERIRAIGHFAPATLAEYLSLTHLTETSRAKNNSQGFYSELLKDHESIIIFLRENIDRIGTKLKDLGTSDFLTGLMEDHEKMAWMLRAHLD